MSIYEGVVVYEAGQEAYDSGYGPKFNVAIEWDDPDAPGKRKAGTNLVAIYKNEGSPEAEYLRTLSKGDRVQGTWEQGGKGNGYWKLHAPKGAVVPVRQPAPRTIQRTSPLEWTPPTDEDMIVWSAMADAEMEKLMACYVSARQSFGEDTPVEDVLKVAITLFINAQRTWKPGMTIAEEDTPDRQLLSLIDEDDVVKSLLNAIVLMHPLFDSATDVIDTLHYFGMSSADIDGEESRLRTWHIAKFYGDMVQGGARPAIAISATASEFDIDIEEDDELAF